MISSNVNFPLQSVGSRTARASEPLGTLCPSLDRSVVPKLVQRPEETFQQNSGRALESAGNSLAIS